MKKNKDNEILFEENQDRFTNKIEDAYSNIYDHISTIKKWIVGLTVLLSVFHIIDTFVNKFGIGYFLIREASLLLIVYLIYLVGKLFHFLFGKWLIIKKDARLTIDYVSNKMPRIMKITGHTGAGKDSTMNALAKIFTYDMKLSIIEEMREIKTICYIYDFKLLKTELDTNCKNFITSSKRKFFDAFSELLIDNDGFIKPYYKEDFLIKEHLDNFQTIKSNPFDIDKIKPIDYKYDDLIKPRHFIDLLIKYAINYIRITYMDTFIITNQPMVDKQGKPAKMISSRFTNIQESDHEWPWPIDGRVIMMQSETDAVYPNTGSNDKSPMKTGLRNFTAFERHLFGEDFVSMNTGQRNKRTNKQLRELEHVFIKIIERSPIDGGEKRRWFIDRWNAWCIFRTQHAFKEKTKEKYKKRISKNYIKKTQLINSGYVYVDVKVSRSDEDNHADQMSLKRLLNHDKKIYENYMAKLCFKKIDMYRGYNTYYIENIGEINANKKDTSWNDVKSWNPDLILRLEHILYMNYKIFKDMIGVDKDGKKKK